MAKITVVPEEGDRVFYDNKSGILEYLHNDLDSGTVVFSTRVKGSKKHKNHYFKSFRIYDFENWNAVDECWDMLGENK
jgi:hypothetical protein